MNINSHIENIVTQTIKGELGDSINQDKLRSITDKIIEKLSALAVPDELALLKMISEKKPNREMAVVSVIGQDSCPAHAELAVLIRCI
jgi:predicted transcriptional regulator